jgi:hypothetical protein
LKKYLKKTDISFKVKPKEATVMKKVTVVKFEKKQKEMPPARKFEQELLYKLDCFERELELKNELESKGYFHGIKLG